MQYSFKLANEDTFMAHNHRIINEQVANPVTRIPKPAATETASRVPTTSVSDSLQRISANPDGLSHADIFQLQRTVGNRGLGALLGRSVVQREEFGADIQQQESTQLQQPHESKPNNTGMPDDLKSGIENLSGFSMDNVRVHYNSPQPSQFNAFAYAQGTEIHLASGQEKHLPHEAWHIIQQAQGRVQPTMYLDPGVLVNNNKALEQEAYRMGTKAEQMQHRGNTSLEHLKQFENSEPKLHKIYPNPSNATIAGDKVMQRAVTLEFEHDNLPLTTRINTLKVDRPANPISKFEDEKGKKPQDDYELRHITAWLIFQKGLKERVEGKSIEEACSNFSLDEYSWSVNTLKNAIENEANDFAGNLENYAWGPKEANNKMGSVSLHAVGKALEFSKKRKLADKPESPKKKAKSNSSKEERKEKAEYNTAVNTGLFSTFDFVPENLEKSKSAKKDEKRKIVRAAKLHRRKSEKLLGKAAKDYEGKRIRVKDIINLPEDMREPYLGKKGKGVKGWERSMIVRYPKFEDMTPDEVSDFDNSDTEEVYPNLKGLYDEDKSMESNTSKDDDKDDDD
jgi:hypothetical protein